MSSRELSFTTKLMRTIAFEKGYEFESLTQNSDHYVITFPDGKRTYGFRSITDINTTGSSRTVKSKIATHEFLKKQEYSTISSVPIYEDMSVGEIEETVQRLGFPCIIKPNSASQARGITVLEGVDDIPKALDHARSAETYGIILAQPFIEGRHVRFMVLDDEVILVYEKPAFWASDYIIETDLSIHESYKKEIARAVTGLGLRWGGVDVIIGKDVDIEKPITKDNYTIVEINSAPTMKRFAELGDSEYQRVKSWYTIILDGVKQNKS